MVRVSSRLYFWLCLVSGLWFGAPAGGVAGARVWGVRAAAGSPAALLKVGVADAAGGGAGDLGPAPGHVRFGVTAACLVHLAGQLVAVGGLGLGQLCCLDRFLRVHAPASSSISAAGSACGEVQLSMSASTRASISGPYFTGSGAGAGTISRTGTGAGLPAS